MEQAQAQPGSAKPRAKMPAVQFVGARKAHIRVDCDADSDKAGILAKGEDQHFPSGLARVGATFSQARAADHAAGTAVIALEIRLNSDGTQRVHYEAGWVSVAAKDGKPILEPAEGSTCPTLSPPGVQYSVLRKTVIRCAPIRGQQLACGERPALFSLFPPSPLNGRVDGRESYCGLTRVTALDSVRTAIRPASSARVR